MYAEIRPDRLAFDTRLYVNGENPEQRLASDLASLVLETAEAPEKRITPFSYIQAGKDKLECPEFANGDILNSLRWETRSDILESKATWQIRDYILSQETEQPFIIVWISPPDENLGYPEGRMVVGIGQQKDGLKTVDNYGICVNFSPDTCLLLGKQLLHFSENKNRPKIESVDQLRATPVFLKPPKETEPLDFVAKLIPLPHVWEKIRSSEAKALKERALQDTQAIARKLAPQIRGSKERWQFILFGAQAEQLMQENGWTMRANSGCGALNTDLLSSSFSTFSHSHLRVDSQGNLSQKSESGVFARKCPYCGRAINKVISPGYTCACGQTYQGVC